MVWKPPGLQHKRRTFIGGSDARVIMGDDEVHSGGSGGKSAARPNLRWTCPAISSSSLVW